ncbi:protein kinase [bacterium]|nr:protein kinase [bacterium]
MDKDSYRGGFGRVEKIRIDGVDYARKTFDPQDHIRQNPDVNLDKLRLRFVREVGVQSQLPSDFFIEISDYDLDGDNPWYDMPWAEKNYEEKIVEDSKLDIIDYDALFDIINSLEELHKLEYVHRDLKPKNILLHNGRWKLADFGLVLVPSSESTQFTSYNSGWGTALYMAPEQMVSFRNVTNRADIYSFGCILHDIAEGLGQRAPFQRLTCSGALSTIIEKCTDVDAERRFKNISLVRESLNKVIIPVVAKIDHDGQVKTFVENFGDMRFTTIEEFEEFNRELEKLADDEDIYNLLTSVDRDSIQAMSELDKFEFEFFALFYCEWVRNTSFGFGTCDTIASILELICDLTNVNVQSSSLIAMSIMGDGHNRWYVMKKLMRLCSNSMNDNLAQRVAVDIVAEGVKSSFISCANSINRSISSYHPLIYNILKD